MTHEAGRYIQTPESVNASDRDDMLAAVGLALDYAESGEFILIDTRNTLRVECGPGGYHVEFERCHGSRAQATIADAVLVGLSPEDSDRAIAIMDDCAARR